MPVVRFTGPHRFQAATGYARALKGLGALLVPGTHGPLDCGPRLTMADRSRHADCEIPSGSGVQWFVVDGNSAEPAGLAELEAKGGRTQLEVIVCRE